MIVILVIAYSAFFRIHDVWNIQMEAAVPVHVCVVVTKWYGNEPQHPVLTVQHYSGHILPNHLKLQEDESISSQ